MRVELEAPVVVHESSDLLWHLPAPEKVWTSGILGGLERRFPLADHGIGDGTWPTLCGLDGSIYLFAGPIRQRRCCTVCSARNGGADHAVPENGPLPARATQRPRARPVSAQLTEPRVLVLHRVYMHEGVGISRLGQLYFERLGFSSAASCANAIANAFRERELPTRTQGEAQRARAAAIRRQGFGGRGYDDRRLSVATVRRLRAVYDAGYSSHEIARRFHTRLGYDSWDRLRSALEYAWKTQGLKLRSNREAELLSRRRGRSCTVIVEKTDRSRPFPCPRHALADSEFCWTHDPRNREQVQRNLLAMQAKINRPPTIDWELVRPHLEPLLQTRPDRLGRHFEKPGGALARNTGVDPAICSRLLKHNPPRITIRRANELLAPLGLAVEQLTTIELGRAA